MNRNPKLHIFVNEQFDVSTFTQGKEQSDQDFAALVDKVTELCRPSRHIATDFATLFPDYQAALCTSH